MAESSLTQIDARRDHSRKRLEELKKQLLPAQQYAKGKACLYVTGSYGRGEASAHSDLDLFIVGKALPVEPSASQLSPLDEICFKAHLIESSRSLRFPEFTDNGRYLTQFTDQSFVKTLGTPEDDVTNIFTARLLLLLESQPLVEAEVYQEIIERVIAKYWRDFTDHGSEFLPTFLANDILRLWRTFCVNYEARTEDQPDGKKAKRKLKNYKLKHSRLLTCYSALIYLLALVRLNDTVTPQDAIQMVRLSPLHRLEWLRTQSAFAGAHAQIDQLFAQYESFLATTDQPESEMISLFLDKGKSRELFVGAVEFGQCVYNLLMAIGQGHRFLRMLIV